MKKNQLLILLIGVAIFFLPMNTAAVTIGAMSRLQPSGWLTFRALKSVPTATVSWKVARWLVDETSGVYTYPTDTMYASGDSAQFNLGKTTGKYTYYKVIAYEGTSVDSLILQVLVKGVVQKYLYSNAALSPYPVPVWVVLPAQYSSSSRFVMAMCGISRDAASLATYWVPFANANNSIIAAPEFNSANWSSSAYILGNMFTGSNGAGNLNPKEKWTFNIVQQIHKELYAACGILDSTFILWGHSAGGQFVHRLAFFLPDKLATLYIAANSGWYTCPDFSVDYPWGAAHPLLNLTMNELLNFTRQRLVIMRGTADTLRDSELNTDPRSDAQGLNRFTRAAYFYNKGRNVNPNSTWQLVDVPNVGHSDQQMAIAAGSYILAHPSVIHETPVHVPGRISLLAYPNPFNASAKIRITLPQPAQVFAGVYDILGTAVCLLADEYLAAGEHEYNFSAGALPSGLYFVRITANEAHSTIKTQLLK